MSHERSSGTGSVQEHLDACSAHAGAAACRLVVDDVVHTDVAPGQRFEGRDAVRRFVDGTADRLSTLMGQHEQRRLARASSRAGGSEDVPTRTRRS